MTGAPEAPQDPPAEEPMNDLDVELEDLFERRDEDPAAREELAQRFGPLAEYLARRFQGRGEPLDDLVQVARIGLLNALDRFDPGRGVRFSTYATTTIVGELKHHFRDRGWGLRVPRRVKEATQRVTRAIGELSQELGHSPTIRQIAETAALSEEDVLEAMDAQQAYAPASLDVPDEETGQPAAASLGTEDERLDLLEDWSDLAPAIQQLSEREQWILYLRFFRDQTQTQIAERLGISQMHVSRLLARALHRLREMVGRGAGGG